MVILAFYAPPILFRPTEAEGRSAIVGRLVADKGDTAKHTAIEIIPYGHPSVLPSFLISISQAMVSYRRGARAAESKRLRRS